MPYAPLAPPAAATITPLLRTAPLFRALDDDTLSALAAQTRLRVLPRQAWLSGMAATDDPLYLVAHGRLALVRCGTDGRDVTLNVLEADDVLGLLPFEAQALGADATLYAFPRPQIRQIAEAHPPSAWPCSPRPAASSPPPIAAMTSRPAIPRGRVSPACSRASPGSSPTEW